LQSVPTIEEIARDPDRVRGLSTEAIAALMARAAAVQGTLSAALISAAPISKPTQPEEPCADRMLTTAEAAAMLRRKPSWIYRHADLPFVKRTSARSPLLCSEQGIRRYLARR